MSHSSTALYYFYAIGEPMAMKQCKNLSISPTIKVAELGKV